MQAVTDGLSREMAQLSAHVRRSLTWDRGMELAGHAAITANTGLDVYFADPHSPWQRGTNENTNRLLRQYFPKGVTMKDLTQTELNQVAAKLNARPRKTLDFDTPAARFAALLR
jgi:IS30 family transposase